jgi:hypothetical protein
VLVRAHRRNLNLIDKALIAGFACFGIGLPARVFFSSSDKGASACRPFQSKKQNTDQTISNLIKYILEKY